MSAAIDHAKRERLIIAAGFNPERGLLAVSGLLGYRKLAAERLLHAANEEEERVLTEVYDFANLELKKALGIP